jgi:hypothetical protein
MDLAHDRDKWQVLVREHSIDSLGSTKRGGGFLDCYY